MGSGGLELPLTTSILVGEPYNTLPERSPLFISARANCETIGRGEKVVDFERDIDCQRIWGDLGEQRHGGD
jgi:hypothetical protein